MNTLEFVKKYGINRKNTDSVKWDGMAKSFDGRNDLIPMWVADADFRCPDAVVQAVEQFAALGVYGYTLAPQTYKQAASKTFNIAGLQNSFLVTASMELGEKLDAELKYDALGWGNPFGYRAAEAAYRHGHEWLGAFLKVIAENYQSLKKILSQDDRIHVYPLEGTYLCWVDLRDCVPMDDIHRVFQDIAGIAVDFGEWFGECGKGFIRINLATIPERVQDVGKRLLEAINV